MGEDQSWENPLPLGLIVQVAVATHAAVHEPYCFDLAFTTSMPACVQLGKSWWDINAKGSWKFPSFH